MNRRFAKVPTAFALFLLALAVAAGCGEDSENGGSSGAAGEQAAGSWALGSWEGVLTQKGLAPFTVSSTVESLADAAANHVRYSGLDCRGSWTPLGGRGDVYRFREEITSGRSPTCKGAGIVTLRRLGDGRAGYSFRGGGVESRGTLKRRDAP